MSPFELVKQRLLCQQAGHPDPEHAVFTLDDIQKAFQDQPIEIIRPIGPETPMGRIQRNILIKLVEMDFWDPGDHRRNPTLLPPYLSAAKGLVARGFAILVGGIYYPTHNGRQEARRKKLVKD